MIAIIGQVVGQRGSRSWRFSFRPLYWGIYLVIDSNQLSNCLSNNQCRRLFDDEVHGNYISRTRSTIWGLFRH